MRERIITELYQDQDLQKLILKTHPRHLQDELKQELFLVLCELQDDVVIDMYERSVLKYWCVRVILNMTRGNRSPFLNKFKGTYDLHDHYCKETEPVSNPYLIELLFNEACNILSKLEAKGTREDYYYANIFKSYIEAGCSSLKLSASSGIPERTIRLAVQETRKYLKSHLQKVLL